MANKRKLCDIGTGAAWLARSPKVGDYVWHWKTKRYGRVVGQRWHWNEGIYFLIIVFADYNKNYQGRWKHDALTEMRGPDAFVVDTTANDNASYTFNFDWKARLE